MRNIKLIPDSIPLEMEIISCTSKKGRGHVEGYQSTTDLKDLND